MVESGSRPSVSVIIPTRNRPTHLKRLLESIESLSYPRSKIETIIVDDASEHPPRAIPQSAKVITNATRLFLAGSRNVGAKNSNGDYLLFVDDDNVLDKNVVEELVSPLISEKKIAVSIPIAFYLNEPTTVWNNLSSDPLYSPLLRSRYSVNIKTPIELRYFHNVFMIPRKILIQFGPFDSLTFPIHLSELEYYLRLQKKGYKAVLTPSAIVWHDVPLYAGRAQTMGRERAFYTLRNRIILARRRGVGFLMFFSTFILPLLVAFHLKVAIENGDMPYFVTIIKGAKAGFEA